uniref:OmpR/PhoB-type domain-containing protein n=1 Tax=Streptomyces avermitilis TaxID=33903 RepID=A0A499V7R4_STRAX|nr:hypothetical protein SAVMC3_10570 [Streptomyces avermitilis]
MDHAISVYTLGSFELAIHGKPIQRWKAGKARDLFQFLLLRQGQVVSRETLHESLWPGSYWSANSSSLKVAVHTLRRVLANCQAPSEETSSPSLRLVTRQTGYTLQARGVWVDSEVFDDLVDQGHRAESAGAHREASQHYRAAAELYGGTSWQDPPWNGPMSTGNGSEVDSSMFSSGWPKPVLWKTIHSR